MPTEKNVALLKAAYRDWEQSKGTNADCWLQILSDNIVLKSLGDGRPGLEFSQERRGKADVGLYLAGLAESWQMVFYRTDEFIAQGDRVAVLSACAWRHRVTGAEVQTPKVDIWRFRNGKIVEFYEFFDTARVQAAAQRSA